MFSFRVEVMGRLRLGWHHDIVASWLNGDLGFKTVLRLIEISIWFILSVG